MHPGNPQMVNCRCCGRQYGHWSIGIHEPQCQKVRLSFVYQYSVTALICIVLFLLFSQKNQQEEANNRLAIRRSQNLSRVSVTPLGHRPGESTFDNQVVPTLTHRHPSNNQLQHNDRPFRPNNQHMRPRNSRQIRPPFDPNPQPNDDVLGHVRISYINGTEFGSDTYAIPRPSRPAPRARGQMVEHGQARRGQSYDMSALLENLPPTVIRSK